MNNEKIIIEYVRVAQNPNQGEKRTASFDSLKEAKAWVKLLSTFEKNVQFHIKTVPAR